MSPSYHAAIDTGCPMDHIHPAIASKIASMYDPPAQKGKELYWVLCGATPPKYGVSIGGEIIWYKPENMFIHIPAPEGLPDGALCLTPFAPLIQGATGMSVLGVPFLRNVLSVFDFERMEMAFAPVA